MYCNHCGKEIHNDVTFCSYCGGMVGQTNVAPAQEKTGGTKCPVCGSGNVDIQVHQENKGAWTASKTKSKYKQKGHGCLWWLFFGWWWWIIDLMLWITIFPIRLLVQIFKRKTYVGNGTTTGYTKNKISYRTVFLCKDCGHHWQN